MTIRNKQKFDVITNLSEDVKDEIDDNNFTVVRKRTKKYIKGNVAVNKDLYEHL